MHNDIMAAETEPLIINLLEAPVGFVGETISKIIKKPVYLRVVEQISIGTQYVRRIVIGHSHYPILRAIVKFESKNIPQVVLNSLLQKKEGIGDILRKNNIKVQRKLIDVRLDSDQKILTRDYEILYNGSTWFQISAEIQLDFFRASKYG